MRFQLRLAAMAASFILASTAQAAAEPIGKCKDGFADGTRVRTEARGDMTIGSVQVGDRVWSFNEMVGKPGWSRILQRTDRGQHYLLLSDFTEPGSSAVTKACWRIRRDA